MDAKTPEEPKASAPIQEEEKETGLIDLTDVSLADLLNDKSTVLWESLQRVLSLTDTDAVAGFSQGLA